MLRRLFLYLTVLAIVVIPVTMTCWKVVQYSRVSKAQIADPGPVYERGSLSFFDIIYPLENGQFLLITVRWESLKKLLFEEKVGERGFIWVMDEAGRVVGDSLQSHVGQVYANWPYFKER